MYKELKTGCYDLIIRMAGSWLGHATSTCLVLSKPGYDEFRVFCDIYFLRLHLLVNFFIHIVDLDVCWVIFLSESSLYMLLCFLNFYFFVF